MFASRGFKLTALLASLVMAFSMVAVDTAEARRGGSFGSRGINTQRVIPATPTSPKATAPVERTMTNGTTRNNGVASTPARPTLFGGLGGALLGGLLFSGLFGMLFGYGFGGFGGMLALLVQLAVVGLIIGWFVRRRQPAHSRGRAAQQLPDGQRPIGRRLIRRWPALQRVAPGGRTGSGRHHRSRSQPVRDAAR